MRRTVQSRSAVVALVAIMAGGMGQPVRGQEIAYEDVVARLKSPDAKVRIDALGLLAGAGYIDAVAPVAALISDPVADVQAQAIATEVSLFLADEGYTRAVANRIVKSKDARLPLLAFVQGPGATVANVPQASVMTALVSGIASSTPRVRFDAMYAVGVLGPSLVKRGQFPDAKGVVSRLLAAMKDPDPALRAASIHVLGRLYESALRDEKANQEWLAQRAEVGDLLIVAMNDPDELVRLSSINALGALRYDRAVRSLVDFCGYYKRDKLGLASLNALAHIAHPSSVSQFASAFEVNDEELRRIALEGTARIGDRAALNALLTRAAADRSPVVRQAAAFARARIGDFSDLSAIIDGFGRADLEENAFAYLVELGSAIAPSLGGAASYRDARVRAGVAEVLGIIGSVATLPALDMLARDRDRTVAAASLRSQKRLMIRKPGVPRTP
ncbi:MAG: HEAT repeat domain-containing protein [Acidobacteria bacterium]|nr:HEAT repeat domain-containing protein [Acidobacteriota bacterium]